MARNAELIRQWEILREIDGARTGVREIFEELEETRDKYRPRLLLDMAG